MAKYWKVSNHLVTLIMEHISSRKGMISAPLWNHLFLNGPIPASFCLFLFFFHYNFNTNWKKCRWFAWDSNPGPQDGRRRWNHGAMAATSSLELVHMQQKRNSFLSRLIGKIPYLLQRKCSLIRTVTLLHLYALNHSG